ncbi:MAG: ribosomal-processing cysteine protease Prp [Clostridiales bacterium]|nr:ribosomal-processing cysteine protease Prp [Clostridiales bacterium]
MTVVEIVRKQGHIVSLSADGHTGYGVEGEDIVCAALSSIIQTALLGLMQVAGVAVKFTRRDDDGFLEFTLPMLSEQTRRDADMILDTMLLGISDLYETYSDFIELKLV